MSATMRLGYLGLEVSDPERWRGFATEVLGLEAVETPGGGSGLRMDEHRCRFFLRKGEADDLAFVGWELPDDASLDATATRLADAGVRVTRCSREEAALRGVTALVRFEDPDGIVTELFHGPGLSPTPFRSEKVASGFLTGGEGMGHILITVKDSDRTERFYREKLGFGLSDYVDTEMMGHPLHAVFLHANRRHHSLAFAAMPAPKRLHHFMVEVNALDDVGLALDRCRAAGVKLLRGLGRHENDRMVSFYAETPSGFAFEFGWGARTVDDADWQPTTWSRISEWGHQPVA
jgi:2,3-dihydroxybiphenyl 1,2-dioxygenase